MNINDLIGTPYRLGARGPDALDCWGLVLEVYRRAGKHLPDYASDGMSRQDLIRLVRAEERIATKIDEPEPLCIVNDNRRGHVGVWVNGAVLHASRGFGVIAQPLEQFRMTYPTAEFFRCQN